MNITYFVHDLSDAAVARRVTLLQWGGGTIRLLGFHRRAQAPDTVSGTKPVGLGQTFDAQLGKRALAVLKACFRLPTLIRAVSGTDLVICRNLEMLVLGTVALSVNPNRKSHLVYECLDIHRKMLGGGLVGRGLRAFERALLQQCRHIIVSSPAFASEYFEKIQKTKTPVLLIENKTQSEHLLVATASSPPPAPPWIIGWFGNLRCQKSLNILASAAEACPDLRIHVAGKPALTAFDDFYGTVERSHGKIVYLGAYEPGDLPALYSKCHFTWAIDFFEEGLNSSWLLPNRLYEGGLWGGVPIALEQVQTGRWLQSRGVGILLEDAGAELIPRILGMTPDRYRPLLAAARSIPPEDLVLTRQDGVDLIARLKA